MKKNLIIALSLMMTIFFSTISKGLQAQTLKVSEVNGSTSRNFQKASESLGKSLSLTFYDNALKLSSPTEKKPIVLKKISDDSYYFDDGIREYRLKITKTFGVISSINIKSNRKSDLDDWMIFIAKRF